MVQQSKEQRTHEHEHNRRDNPSPHIGENEHDEESQRVEIRVETASQDIEGWTECVKGANPSVLRCADPERDNSVRSPHESQPEPEACGTERDPLYGVFPHA